MPRLKAEQRKEQLLDIATRVFARGGYAATTTSEIAHAAGVTEPILYRHFKNKQELFQAIVENVSDVMIASFEELIAHEPDPAKRIRRVCSTIAEHIRKYSDSYHVLHGALTTSRDKRVVDVIRAHYGKIHAFFKTLIKQGQDAGTFDRSISPTRAAWHIVMAGVGYSTLSLNLGIIDRAAINETIEEVIKGLQK
jgi:AcrR family transcriptional regulator